MSRATALLLRTKSAHRWTGVTIGVVVVALLVGFAGLILDNDRATRQALADRFGTRAALTASFAHEFVNDQAGRERRQAERRLAAPDVDRQEFESVVNAFEFKAALLLDGKGRLLHVWPRRPELLGRDMTTDYRHLRDAAGGRIAVSGVVPSAARGLPIAAVAVPFRGAGERRVFSGAFAPTATPLGSYLDVVVPIAGGAAVIVDESGEVVVSGGGSAGEEPALRTLPVGITELELESGLTTAVVAEVPDVPWRVVITAPSDALYAPLAHGRFAPWALWAALAASACLAFTLFFRLARARNDAAETARTDALTRLPNRRAMQELLQQSASLSSRHNIPLAALMIDIDRFKRINDAYGHDAGDGVLRAVAAALGNTIRDSDVAGRWGGEEFLVLLPHADEVSATIAAERIRDIIASTVLTNGSVGQPVTTSIGIAALRGGDTAQLLCEADAALYVAKDGGRNRVALWAAAQGAEMEPVGSGAGL